MSQERIDLDALFDQQEPSQPVPQKPSKKPLVLILASVLVLAVLAVGGYLYWQFTDISDPIRITVYKQPLAEDNFTEVSLSTLPDFWDRAVFDITDGYRRFYVEPNGVRINSLSGSNFWIFIQPNSWAVREDWSVDAQIENICSAPSHPKLPQPSIGYYTLLDEKLEFDGWVVFGHLPRSADLQIRLNNGNGEEVTSQTVHVDPYISPIKDYAYFHIDGVTDQTSQFLDYVVHLRELESVMELPEEERLPAYLALAKEQPVLLSLLNRHDLLKTIDNYIFSGDPACETYAQELKPLFDAYIYSDEYNLGYSKFISSEEAAAMDTQSLVDYLVHNTDLRDYIVLNIAQIIYLEDKVDIFPNLCLFCSPLQELASRDDAASLLLPLVPENLVARHLISLPQIQRSLKLDELEAYLLAVYRGANINLNVEVVELLTNMDDMSYLAVSGTLQETIHDLPLFQRELFRPSSVSLTSFFGRLRSSRATDTQKAVATAFLSMPAYQELMNKNQKKLFEESKVILDP